MTRRFLPPDIAKHPHHQPTPWPRTWPAAASVDGIVITHGTDTMEETAILLDLVHADPRPVVLTGAQRASDALDTDGPRNLADAVHGGRGPAQLRGSRGGRGVRRGGAAARGERASRTRGSRGIRAVPAGTLGDVVRRLRDDARAIPHRPVMLAHPAAELDEVRVDLLDVSRGRRPT